MTRKITKITFAAFFLLFILNLKASAQFTRVGGGLSFSTGIENDDHKTGNPGINARGVMEIGEKFWLVPELGFYMPGKRQHSTFGMGITLFGSADVNATYALATEGAILFYALGGVNLSWVSTSYDAGNSSSNFLPGLNIGTGVEMIIEKDLNGFAQIRGVIGAENQYLAISLGVHYYINGRRYKSW
ncbi:outer membrane beta-barrel protein [Bacteroidota bacterium]